MTILASLQESATSVILAADAQELYFDKTALMRLFQPATKFDHIELPNSHLAWAWSGGSPPGGDFDEWVHGQTFDSWEILKACVEDEVSRLHLSYAGIERAEISIIVAAYMENKIRVRPTMKRGGR